MRRSEFRKTLLLIKHAFRIEKIRYLVWVAGIFSLMLVATHVNGQFTAEEMKEIVILSTGEPGMRMLVSPITEEGVSEISRFVFFRFSFIFSILFAIMSVQIVTRLTRLEEDASRAELVATSGAGRYARLSSALIVAFTVNLVAAFGMMLGLVINGLEFSGSLVAGLSYAGLGIVVAAFSALAAELSGNASSATGFSAITFGAFFVLNALANVTGNVHEDALGFESSFLAWFTPMGWTQEVYPFDDRNLWIFAFFLAAFVLVSLGAFYFVDKRDVGRGVLADRQGREHAPVWMRRPLGLVWRLQRGAFLAWVIPVAFLGIAFGAATEDLGVNFEDHEYFGEAFAEAAREMPFILTAVTAMVVSFYARVALLKMRKEEASGPLENVLSTPLPRLRWMAGHVLVGMAGSVILVLTYAFTQALVIIESPADIGEHLLGGLVQAGPVFLIAGLIIALFGLVPRRAGAVTIALILFFILAGSFFGPILDLPNAVKNLSPFTHADFLPENASIAKIITLYILGGLFAAIGFLAFKRRNLSF